MRLLVSGLIALGLLLTGPPTAVADQPPPNVPAPVAKAYRELACKSGYQIDYNRPRGVGALCRLDGHSKTIVAQFVNRPKALRYWLRLAGRNRYITVKGHLFMIPLQGTRRAAEYAQRRVGGRIYEGGH